MGIGAKIRVLRERAGLTQGQLAEMIGVTAAAVGNYEHEVSFPRDDTLYRLFGALHCEPNELFEGMYTESAADAEHLKKYRVLDEYGRELVDACTEIEYRRCTEEPKTILVAARCGGAPKRITIKKQSGSIKDLPKYNGGRR